MSNFNNTNQNSNRGNQDNSLYSSHNVFMTNVSNNTPSLFQPMNSNSSNNSSRSTSTAHRKVNNSIHNKQRIH